MAMAQRLIAKKLGISRSDVRKDLESALRKLGKYPRREKLQSLDDYVISQTPYNRPLKRFMHEYESAHDVTIIGDKLSMLYNGQTELERAYECIGTDLT